MLKTRTRKEQGREGHAGTSDSKDFAGSCVFSFQQTFPEGPLCAQHYSSHLGFTSEQNRPRSLFLSPLSPPTRRGRQEWIQEMNSLIVHNRQMLWEKEKVEQDMLILEVRGRRRARHLYVVRDTVIEKGAFEQRFEGNDKVRQTDMWAKRIPVVGTANAQALRQNVLGMSEEGRGGCCGWSGRAKKT